MHLDLGPMPKGRSVSISLWKGWKVFVVERRTQESQDKTSTLQTSYFNLSFHKALSTAGKNQVKLWRMNLRILWYNKKYHFLFILQSFINTFLISPTVMKLLGAIQKIVHKLFPVWDAEVWVCCSLQESCVTGIESLPLPSLMNWWGELSSISLLSVFGSWWVPLAQLK